LYGFIEGKGRRSERMSERREREREKGGGVGGERPNCWGEAVLVVVVVASHTSL